MRDCIDKQVYKERRSDISDQKISSLAAQCSIDLGHKRDVMNEQAEKKKMKAEEANSKSL